MGNLTPTQMYQHTLVSVKGPGRLNRLDYAAPPKALEAIAPGMVCSLDDNGQFVAGCGKGTTASGQRPMPMFAIQDTDAFDANSDAGNFSGGVQSALVATGGFEIETTEFNTGETYKPNTMLIPDGASAGRITVAGAVAPYGVGAPVVGIVSKGRNTNYNGIGTLRFWTVFLPSSFVA